MHAPDFLVAGLPGGTEFHLLTLGRTHARAGQVTSALDTLAPLARSLAGMLNAERRMTMDVTRLFWTYMAGQGAVGLALLHGFPRVLA